MLPDGPKLHRRDPCAVRVASSHLQIAPTAAVHVWHSNGHAKPPSPLLILHRRLAVGLFASIRREETSLDLAPFHRPSFGEEEIDYVPPRGQLDAPCGLPLALVELVKIGEVLLDAEHRLEQGATICLGLAVTHPAKLEPLVPCSVWTFPEGVAKIAQGSAGHLGLLLGDEIDHMGALHRSRTLAGFDKELKISICHPSSERLAVQLAIADSRGSQCRGGEFKSFTLGIL
mmetsp:Transcript_25134/g.64274  ORF Transcript_25134/g.64274 Transcript_25134/m.64274 type:complete len:230 (+) Transcript_25134:121-810(+)